MQRIVNNIPHRVEGFWRAVSDNLAQHSGAFRMGRRRVGIILPPLRHFSAHPAAALAYCCGIFWGELLYGTAISGALGVTVRYTISHRYSSDTSTRRSVTRVRPPNKLIHPVVVNPSHVSTSTRCPARG